MYLAVADLVGGDDWVRPVRPLLIEGGLVEDVVVAKVGVLATEEP